MNRKLTGNIAYRVGYESYGLFFRRRVLILQVEETYDHTTPCGPSFDTRRCIHWRDADVMDLTQLACPSTCPLGKG